MMGVTLLNLGTVLTKLINWALSPSIINHQEWGRECGKGWEVEQQWRQQDLPKSSSSLSQSLSSSSSSFLPSPGTCTNIILIMTSTRPGNLDYHHHPPHPYHHHHHHTLFCLTSSSSSSSPWRWWWWWQSGRRFIRTLPWGNSPRCRPPWLCPVLPTKYLLFLFLFVNFHHIH